MLKKLLSLCLAMCLLLSNIALAEFPQQSDTVLEGGSLVWIVLEAADRLEKRVDGGMMLCDMQGNALSDTVYYSMADNSKYIQVSVVEGKYRMDGIVNLNGVEVMPAEFDYVSIHDDWAYGVLYGDGTDADYDIRVHDMSSGDVLYKVYDTVCLYNLITGECVDVIEDRNFDRLYTSSGYANVSYRNGDVIAYSPTGEKLSVQPRNVFDTAHVVTSPLANWDSVYDCDTERYALVDANGNQVTAPLFDSISVTMANQYGAHYFEVEDEDDHVGLLNESGDMVVPMAYEEILTVGKDYTTNNVFAATTEDVFTLIRDGAAVDFVMDHFESYGITFLGTHALVNTNDDRWELLYPDGSVQVLPDNLTSFSVRFFNGKAYLICTEEGDEYRSVLMDDRGNVLLIGTDSGSRIRMTSGGHVVVLNDNSTAVYSLR